MLGSVLKKHHAPYGLSTAACFSGNFSLLTLHLTGSTSDEMLYIVVMEMKLFETKPLKWTQIFYNYTRDIVR